MSISPFALFNDGAANVSTNFAGAEAAVSRPPLCVLAMPVACACLYPIHLKAAAFRHICQALVTRTRS